MKVATFNVNSIRVRLPVVLDWMDEHEVDVLAVQETKVEDSKFPLFDFEEHGYHVAYQGQKTHNGVAIISRHALSNVYTGFNDPLFPEDCRLIGATVNGLHIINTYCPNGTQVNTPPFDYKLRWFARFKQMVAARYRPSDKVLWVGDINIAPKPEDVYDSKRMLGRVGHHPAEFAALDDVLSWGWTDLFRKFTQGAGHYTFWDFVSITAWDNNRGWRIDHLYASPGLLESCTACEIDRTPRGLERPSDHVPVWATFD